MMSSWLSMQELKLLAGKGLVSSVASFNSLWSLLSHSYFYDGWT